MSKILLKNGYVLTKNVGELSFEKMDVLIDGNIISKVEPNIARDNYEKIINAKENIVMPGLINCHNHAPMVLFRGYSDDLRLMEWLNQKIWPAEKKLSDEDVYWSTMLACAEMIKSGTTSFADMYSHIDAMAKAVIESGIRASLSNGMVLTFEDKDEAFNETKRIYSKWNLKENGRITIMVAPHAPYTCPPDTIKGVIELSKELNDCPVHIHLSETTEEVEMMYEKYNMSPTRYLYELGLFENRHVLLAHSVNLSQDEVHMLKGMKGGISHNPVSNQKLGCGIAPIKEYKNLGITVALGTDGAGSATTLDMFEEIKAAAWIQKNKFGDPTAITAKEVIEMATINGSKVINLENDIGSIEVGKKADIIIIDINKPHLCPHNDLFAMLAYSANGADVDTTIVDGKILMENRKLLFVDEQEIINNVNKIMNKLLK